MFFRLVLGTKGG
ncbi:hypothetical protein AYI70_g8612, partial [Smittium culicis]